MIVEPIKMPSRTTLKKYGLSNQEWLAMYLKQGGKCPCGKPLGERICVDHMHVRGWKKMLPDQRKQYVRGLTDWRCNYHFLGKGMTAEMARNFATYLDEFEKRKPK